MEENIKLKQVKLIKENNKLLLTKNINYISHLKKKKKKKIKKKKNKIKLSTKKKKKKIR